MNRRGKNASSSECRAIFSAYGRRPGAMLALAFLVALRANPRVKPAG
jgi:hypothetical protein